VQHPLLTKHERKPVDAQKDAKNESRRPLVTVDVPVILRNPET
jgi:hypothetical protein